MSAKLFLARMLHPIERGIDAIKGRPDGPVEIDAYGGYETPRGAVLRGRVLAVRPRGESGSGDSRLRNSWNFARLFFTDEVAGIDLQLVGTPLATRTDEEGYFEMTVPADLWQRRRSMTVRCAGSEAEVPIHVVPDTAAYGIISDIDDTMMRTGAYSLALNLWTSITGNPLTRRIFADAVAMMKRLTAGGNPVFYVSSSPWNLHRYLHAVFERHELPLGPMFLRDLGLSEDQFITGTHGDHKTAAIETILAANPGLSFILIGDTGQHDARIYAGIAERHPGRVRRIILRQPPEDLDDETRAALAEIRALGVPCHLSTHYAGVQA